MTNTSDEDGYLRTALVAVFIAISVTVVFFIPNPPEQVPDIEKPKPEQSHFINTVYAEEIDFSTETVSSEDKVPELHPELEVICGCESAGYPHKDENGELLSGFVDPRDKGECQINTYYHGETMEQMGLDIENDVDYYTYANYLFETQGRQPWMASASCWSPIIGY